MRLRLLAAAVLAGALAVPAQADPFRFERECSGKVDAACHDEVCGILDCVKRDCVVYSSITGTGYAAVCVLGKERPRGSDSR